MKLITELPARNLLLALVVLLTAIITYDVFSRPVSVTTIAEEAIPSVVIVQCSNVAMKRGSLTAGFVFKDNFVLTVSHGVDDCRDSKGNFAGVSVVYWDEFPKGFSQDPVEKHAAHVLKFNAMQDLAVLYIPTAPEAKILKVDASSNYRLGTTAISIGHPKGNLWTVQPGIVNGERCIPLPYFRRFVQISAATNSGNSGGPILNSDGDVIGIAVFNQGGNFSLGFIIPGEVLRTFIYDYLN